ncbi:hypothetical protein K8I85_03790 [bacterium]|nr:hypothetical protein [bacterium]
MKKVTVVLSALLLCAPVVALAQSEQILHVSGHSWETGGFPSSVPGDELDVLFILNAIEQPLVWDTANYGYTGHVRQLVSVGETVFNGLHVASYTGGLFTIYVDWFPGSGGTAPTYGTNPPNATAPSSFTDGISTYLDGFFTDFTLTFNDATLSGSFSGTLNFTGGDVFPLLSATEGWTFGANLAGVSPEGYDLQVNGDVYLAIVSVDEQSWGGIKNLYR